MRLQRFPATVASRNWRVERLTRQCCAVEGNVIIDIVEVSPIDVAIEALGGSAIRENDVGVFELDMQIFKDICLHRAQLGDAASVDQITRRYQKSVYEKAVMARHVEIAVGQIAIERAARDFDRSDVIIPRCLSVALKTHMPNPLDGLGLAGD